MRLNIYVVLSAHEGLNFNLNFNISNIRKCTDKVEIEDNIYTITIKTRRDL